GRPFQLWTDHKPLLAAMTRISPPISPRQQRHLAFVSEFNVLLVYVPGPENVVADFLSRPPQVPEATTAAAATTPVNFQALAAAQLTCKETQQLLTSNSLQIVYQDIGDLQLAGDASTGVFRPLVPVQFRHNIFNQLHDIAHPGRLASRRIVSSRFVWRGLAKDVTAWAAACLECQRSKVHRHTRVAPLPIAVPRRRFSHIHVDLVGP
ncbi:MAG: hypothetical protein AN484_27985, partial [Aphanizomenon flos-aquae WA102]